jgi:hypothetical protein
VGWVSCRYMGLMGEIWPWVKGGVKLNGGGRPNRLGLLEFLAQFDKNSVRKISDIGCGEAAGYIR